MIVVVIMGILASISVPYYLKTVENSKASDAAAIGHMLGNANRMFLIDNPGGSVSGKVTNSCNSGSCGTDSTACRLVQCNYLAQQDWDNASYNFFVCNPTSGAGGGCCASGLTACAVRNSGTYSGKWTFTFTNAGGCTATGSGVPSCPKF